MVILHSSSRNLINSLTVYSQTRDWSAGAQAQKTRGEGRGDHKQEGKNTPFGGPTLETATDARITQKFRPALTKLQIHTNFIYSLAHAQCRSSRSLASHSFTLASSSSDDDDDDDGWRSTPLPLPTTLQI